MHPAKAGRIASANRARRAIAPRDLSTLPRQQGKYAGAPRDAAGGQSRLQARLLGVCTAALPIIAEHTRFAGTVDALRRSRAAVNFKRFKCYKLGSLIKANKSDINTSYVSEKNKEAFICSEKSSNIWKLIAYLNNSRSKKISKGKLRSVLHAMKMRTRGAGTALRADSGPGRSASRAAPC